MKIASKSMLFGGIEILLVLTLLPVTQCLPSLIRWALQGISILLFLVGLFFERNKRYLIGYLVCVVFALIYVYNVWNFNESIFTCAFNVMTVFAFSFYGVIFLTQENIDKKYQMRIVTTIIFLVFITSVTTIIGLQKYPLAVRELGRVGSGYSSSGQDFLMLKTVYKLNNIASWSIVYGIVLATPWFINRYKESKKIKYLIELLIVSICILKAQLTIGMIVTMLLIFLSIYQPSHKPKDIVLALIILLIGILLILFSNEILLFIVQITGSRNLGMISGKLLDLSFLLQGKQTGNVLVRFERYTRSLKHFLDHPFVGLSIYGVHEYGLFGNHSDFFDMAGYYGLFGLFVLLVIIYNYFADIQKSVSIYSKWNVLVPFVGLIIVFVLNPVWYSPQVFATAILLPCCTYLKPKKELC